MTNQIRKIQSSSINNFMSSPCIFGSVTNPRECQHAECKIIRTIKKINRPIFKKTKPERPARKHKEDILWSGESSEDHQDLLVQNIAKRQEGCWYGGSQKTIASSQTVGRRVVHLQEQIRMLKTEVLWLRARLQSSGIL